MGRAIVSARVPFPLIYNGVDVLLLPRPFPRRIARPNSSSLALTTRLKVKRLRLLSPAATASESGRRAHEPLSNA